MVHGVEHGCKMQLARESYELGQFAHRELKAGVSVKEPEEPSYAHWKFKAVLLLQLYNGKEVGRLISLQEYKVGRERRGLFALVRRGRR